jgi:hypothetical protein
LENILIKNKKFFLKFLKHVLFIGVVDNPLKPSPGVAGQDP